MMPAKKPAPKAAKGKKAASRPPAQSPEVARKPAERVKADTAAHGRQSEGAAKKAEPHGRSSPSKTEDTSEIFFKQKTAYEIPENPGTSNQILVPPRARAELQAADGDDNDA